MIIIIIIIIIIIKQLDYELRFLSRDSWRGLRFRQLSRIENESE